MEEVEPMKKNTITNVAVIKRHSISINCNDGNAYEIDLGKLISSSKAFAPLKDAKAFATAQVGLWGHSVEWDNGIDIGVDRLVTLASEASVLGREGSNPCRRAIVRLLCVNLICSILVMCAAKRRTSG